MAINVAPQARSDTAVRFASASFPSLASRDSDSAQAATFYTPEVTVDWRLTQGHRALGRRVTGGGYAASAAPDPQYEGAESTAHSQRTST
jgi:hypothetical protein